MPIGPIVLPQSWQAQASITSHINVGGVEFHDIFLQYRVEETIGVMN